VNDGRERGRVRGNEILERDAPKAGRPIEKTGLLDRSKAASLGDPRGAGEAIEIRREPGEIHVVAAKEFVNRHHDPG
jgi:hypothetical protein